MEDENLIIACASYIIIDENCRSKKKRLFFDFTNFKRFEEMLRH